MTDNTPPRHKNFGSTTPLKRWPEEFDEKPVSKPAILKSSSSLNPHAQRTEPTFDPHQSKQITSVSAEALFRDTPSANEIPILSYEHRENYEDVQITEATSRSAKEFLREESLRYNDQAFSNKNYRKLADICSQLEAAVNGDAMVNSLQENFISTQLELNPANVLGLAAFINSCRG